MQHTKQMHDVAYLCWKCKWTAINRSLTDTVVCCCGKDDDDDDDADSGDDEAELMAELQKIKKERIAEMARRVCVSYALVFALDSMVTVMFEVLHDNTL